MHPSKFRDQIMKGVPRFIKSVIKETQNPDYHSEEAPNNPVLYIIIEN